MCFCPQWPCRVVDQLGNWIRWLVKGEDCAQRCVEAWCILSTVSIISIHVQGWISGQAKESHVIPSVPLDSQDWHSFLWRWRRGDTVERKSEKEHGIIWYFSSVSSGPPLSALQAEAHMHMCTFSPQQILLLWSLPGLTSNHSIVFLLPLTYSQAWCWAWQLQHAERKYTVFPVCFFLPFLTFFPSFPFLSLFLPSPKKYSTV